MLLKAQNRREMTHFIAACGRAYSLRWSAMLLEAQNRRKMAHFIAICGRALSLRKYVLNKGWKF